MGFYYSLSSGATCSTRTFAVVAEMNLPQTEELVTRYEPDIVWADGERDYSDEELRSVDSAWLYNESPVKESVVVNDRRAKDARQAWRPLHDRIRSGSFG